MTEPMTDKRLAHIKSLYEHHAHDGHTYHEDHPVAIVSELLTDLLRAREAEEENLQAANSNCDHAMELEEENNVLRARVAELESWLKAIRDDDRDGRGEIVYDEDSYKRREGEFREAARRALEGDQEEPGDE